MTGSQRDVRPTTVPGTLGDHQRRIQILEAVVPSTGTYLQARGAKYSGWDFLTLNANSYPGGNGASWFDGDWQFITDATSPFGGVALETTTDGDWYPFPLGNLGPQGTGYGMSMYYFGATDNAQIDIEFATTSIDEFSNTSGPNGSTTSVLGPGDFEFWDAPLPGWYNNSNLTPDHGYRFDLSNASAGWTQFLLNISTFTLESADGTPLTANSPGFESTWDESSIFNAGGGPDLWWWMRVKVHGPGIAGSGGFRVRLGQVWVYRLNSVLDFVG